MTPSMYEGVPPKLRIECACFIGDEPWGDRWCARHHLAHPNGQSDCPTCPADHARTMVVDNMPTVTFRWPARRTIIWYALGIGVRPNDIEFGRFARGDL